MSANTSPDMTPTPSKESPSCPERDRRKATQDDASTETPNNPPNHGIPTHGKSRFLLACPKDTPLDELGERYQEWQRAIENGEHWSRAIGDSEQATLTGWD